MPGAAYCVGVSVASALVCLTVAILVFRRRNLAGC
jgi:hypothetical protein